MANGKKHTPEQIISLLRQIEVAVANGKTTSTGVPAALSPHHGVAEAGGQAGWQVPGGAHLASRRAEGSAEAEAARSAVVQRWIVRAAAAQARQPCKVVRLRKREDVRRKDEDRIAAALKPSP
jgi:hypothetical protein